MSKTDFSKLAKGQVLSEIQFYTVDSIQGNEVILNTESGHKIALPKEYVEEFTASGNQYSEAIKVSRTELTEIMFSNPRIAMTVNFQKQVKAADVVKEAMIAYANSTPTEYEKKLKKAVNTGMNGEERTMVGYHFLAKDGFGRLTFVDMTLDPKTDPSQGKRLVDPRTLNWVIVGGKKYEVK